MYGIIFLLITMPLFCAADFVKALPKGVIFTNAVVNQLLQVNQLRARNVIISGDLVVEGSIINGSGSSSGGSGSSGIQTIDGNSGSVTGTTVTIGGGNNITTSGSGTALTVSVSGTTDNAVQIGNASGSLSSVALGTTGEVLTSNGPGAAPTFQPAASGSGIMTINTDGGSTASGTTVLFQVLNSSNGTPQGTSVFSGDGASTVSLDFSPGLSNNLAIGLNSLTGVFSLTSNNVVFGNSPGTIGDGTGNTFLGNSIASGGWEGGTNNIFIGLGTAAAYTGAETNNINIGVAESGTPGENNVIRIGSNNTSVPYATCFIGGINGVSVTGSAVMVSSAGQLGTVVSSRRFKENIEPMGNSYSKRIYTLEPVLFTYKKDATKTKTWGLIAEQVQEVFPELVINDAQGNPLTVRYHDLSILLLNEVIYLRSVVEKLLAQS